jgi:RNA polymerase sigma-70 factor (ECF subfamily)
MSASKLSQRLVSAMPRLRRFARALTGMPQDAEDLINAAVVRALEQPPSIASDAEFERWLLRVARNLWIDELRSAERRLRDSFRANDWEDEVESNAGDAELAKRLNEVDAAMRQIPPDLRVVLVFVCVEGYTYQETADLMGIPVGTVMSRLARARLRLGELLQ